MHVGDKKDTGCGLSRRSSWPWITNMLHWGCWLLFHCLSCKYYFRFICRDGRSSALLNRWGECSSRRELYASVKASRSTGHIVLWLEAERQSGRPLLGDRTGNGNYVKLKPPRHTTYLVDFTNLTAGITFLPS